MRCISTIQTVLRSLPGVPGWRAAVPPQQKFASALAHKPCLVTLSVTCCSLRAPAAGHWPPPGRRGYPALCASGSCGPCATVGSSAHAALSYCAPPAWHLRGSTGSACAATPQRRHAMPCVPMSRTSGLYPSISARWGPKPPLCLGRGASAGHRPRYRPPSCTCVSRARTRRQAPQVSARPSVTQQRCLHVMKHAAGRPSACIWLTVWWCARQNGLIDLAPGRAPGTPRAFLGGVTTVTANAASSA